MNNELTKLNETTFFSKTYSGAIIYQKEFLGDNKSIYISNDDLKLLLDKLNNK